MSDLKVPSVHLLFIFRSLAPLNSLPPSPFFPHPSPSLLSSLPLLPPSLTLPPLSSIPLPSPFLLPSSLPLSLPSIPLPSSFPFPSSFPHPSLPSSYTPLSPSYTPPSHRDLLQTSTAADFYSTMALLGERLRKAQLLPSAEFIQIIHTVQECIATPGSVIPPIKTLREKYTYNICPCATPEDDDLSDPLGNHRPCPVPSRGGAFSLSPADGAGVSGSQSEEKTRQFKEKGGLREMEFINGQRNPSLPEGELKGNPIKAQVRLLQEHYNLTAKQPATVKCNIDLAPPQACITCPQTRCSLVKGHAPTGRSMLRTPAYGPDVPDDVVEQSKVCWSSIPCY